jgi:HlyD family secretion protein
MKKWLVLLLVAGLIAFGWYYARTNVRVTPEWETPKFEKLVRGDIRVPVTAPGIIEPAARIEIKPEASGRVIEVRVREGDFVRKNDVLVIIKQDDEERSVQKAEANLQRVEASLEQAKVAVERAKSNIDVQDARVRELTASLERAEFDKNEKDKMSGITTEQEKVNTRTSLEAVRAQHDAAKANAQIARLSVKDADEAVKIQTAAVQEARNSLEDARQRLADTTIVSEHDAIITNVAVKVGNVVQSGTGSFTGGSILLVMADVSKIKVLTRVDESDFGRVSAIAPVDALPDMPGGRASAAGNPQTLARRTGEVTVTVDAFPDNVFKGRIERVEPQGKLNSGSAVIQFDVYIELTDEQRHILPLGAQATVEFAVESATAVLLVPADAVKTHKEKKGLWVRTDAKATSDEKNPRKFIECRFGITDGAQTQVIAAAGGEELREGMEVFTRLPVVRNTDAE